MREIVLATRNKKKIEEFKRITKDTGVALLTLDDFPGCPEVIEDGVTFEENAEKKAKSVAAYTGKAALADDSGLEVNALNGAPGVRSARFAGKNADDEKNVKKLLFEMRSLGPDKRGARFVCCMVLAFPDGIIHKFFGYAEGIIATEPKGIYGFGYDPVFYPEGHRRTFAEMPDEEKDALSHRGKALRQVYEFLRTRNFIGSH